jgi:hypothetical protein
VVGVHPAITAIPATPIIKPANIMAAERMSMCLPPAVHPLPGGAPEIADDIRAMIGAARQESAFFWSLSAAAEIF